MKKFISTERKGFKITFRNGLTVSVQWGTFNRCDNKNKYGQFHPDILKFDDMSANNAEVAFMLDDIFIHPAFILQGHYDVDGPYVLGYQTPEEVADILYHVKKYSRKDIECIKLQIILAQSLTYDHIESYP